jgi:hypothetical protein
MCRPTRPPNPKTASRICGRSSSTSEPPAVRRHRSNPPNSTSACGAHRMETVRATTCRQTRQEAPRDDLLSGFTHCTRNLKGNFRIGMRTEKSRLRRSLVSLQDLLRRIRHWSVREQVNALNAALRGHTPTTALPETFVPCKRSIGRSNATGTKCCAAGVGPGASRGTCSTSLNSGNRFCDQSCTFPIGSYKLSQCCESSSEERSARNLHATFCGNRGRAIASGDPVGGTARCPPIPINQHDGIGMSLYAERLERGRFIWPSPADGTVAISASQLA